MPTSRSRRCGCSAWRRWSAARSTTICSPSSPRWTSASCTSALEEAVAAQLLVVDESVVIERYEFRHALTAEAAAEAVLPSQRRRLHVTIAEHLEKTPAPGRHGGAEAAGHLAEIAHHWFEARELPRALESAIKAGEAAASSGAFVEAFRQYERALELWDVVPSPEEIAGIDRIELLRRTAQAGQLSGEFMQAVALLREAIALLLESGDRIRAGVFHERLGRALWTSGKLDDSLSAYRTAVEMVPTDPPTADRARVLAGYAQVLMLGGRYSESLPIAREANQIAKAIGERQLEGHSAATLGIDMVYADADGEEVGVRTIREAMAIAEEVRDVDDIGRGYACLSSALDVLGRTEEGMQVALDGGERMKELGMSVTYGSFVLMNAVDGMITLGRWDEALQIAEASEPISRGNGRIFANIQLARIHTPRGNIEAATRCARRREPQAGPPERGAVQRAARVDTHGARPAARGHRVGPGHRRRGWADPRTDRRSDDPGLVPRPRDAGRGRCGRTGASRPGRGRGGRGRPAW